MFIRETSRIAQSFEYLAPHFVAPGWLHPLAIAAVSDALQLLQGSSSEGSRDPAITVWPDAFSYELGPVRVRLDELAVAMRWNSQLPPELFPGLFDGDLRVERVEEARSDLTVVGTYPRSKLPAVDPNVIQRATKTWASGFLANIVRSLSDNPPRPSPTTR